jgi:SpoVK/Ycf46/Vps4 family AAA+-type ATPase
MATTNTSAIGKFKFKDLKVHGTNEWLQNSQKKYRQVFDAQTVKYIYCELLLHNLLFDKEDWSVNINFKIYDSANALLCDKIVTQTVTRAEDVACIRYSWGNQNPGTYWFKGSYRWEAWIEGFMVGSRLFYTIGEPAIPEYSNPYFTLSSVKIYEGPAEDVPYGQRNYLKVLNGNTLRYIWIEIEGKNLQNSKAGWWGEFFLRIRTAAGEPIANIVDLYNYPQTIDIIRFSRGWGSKDPGSWYIGDYVIDIVFMERLLGTVYFSVKDYEEADAGSGKFYLPGEGVPVLNTVPPERKELSSDEIMKELDELIGLESIKENVRDLYDYLRFLKHRREKGVDDVNERIGLNLVFTGNPGTGKTTVAKLLGKIYFNLGLLSKGHVHEVDRGDLIAGFIGQTAPKTKEEIKKAKGGILFIDEAYALHREGSEKDFGEEAIEVLMKEMSDGDGDLAVIVAGYPDEMNSFLNSNPGLKSRFSNYFNFPDYTPKELLEIANYKAKELDIELSKPAEEFLYTKLVEFYRDRDKSFGNARLVNSTLGEAKMNLGLRLMEHYKSLENVDNTVLSVVELDDVKDIFKKKKGKIAEIPEDEELLRDSLNELNNMTGMAEIKNDVNEMVKLVRYYREIGKDVTKSFSLHTVFTGNPGTGKTTVARIMARIFRSLGVLERGHLVEVDRESLIAGYIGQTAIKTAAKIDEAMGGVLFIDEAYALANETGDNDDFGKEAVEIILKRMEDNRGEFVVICAGYPAEMEEFLKMNPGLKSRFDRKFHFPDYNEEELYTITKGMLKEQDLVFDSESSDYFKRHIASLYSHRDKFFGNARDIRKSLSEVIKNQNLRLAEIPKKDRTAEMIKTINLKDVEELSTEVKKDEQRMGF